MAKECIRGQRWTHDIRGELDSNLPLLCSVQTLPQRYIIFYRDLVIQYYNTYSLMFNTDFNSLWCKLIPIRTQTK